LNEYDLSIKLDLLPQKIQSLNRQLHTTYSRKDMLMNQLNVFESDFELIKKQYGRDSLLFVKGAISAAELEVSKSSLYQKQNSCIEANITYKNNVIQI